MMTDWLCRQGEHGKIELEDTQTAVEMLRGMMVMDTQRKQRSRYEQSNVHGSQKRTLSVGYSLYIFIAQPARLSVRLKLKEERCKR